MRPTRHAYTVPAVAFDRPDSGELGHDAGPPGALGSIAIATALGCTVSDNSIGFTNPAQACDLKFDDDPFSTNSREEAC